MALSIGQKFTTKSLLKFALPSMIMMGFMSLYTIVDGMFVSRYVSSQALSALNIVYPAINLLLAVGIMLATGGSAVVSKLFGEGRADEARGAFSLIAAVSVVLSIVMLAATILFAEPISRLLGADDTLLADSKMYLCIMMLFAPACMLQSLYQSFFVTAGKPKMGLILTLCAGLINIVLDYVFIAHLGLGVAGAALATGIGQAVPAVFGTVFFVRISKELYFTKFRMQLETLLLACGNGSSEMVTQLSNAVITVLFNITLMKLAGSDGVAAISIILYAQFLFSSLYLGLSIGVAPIFGYYYGAKKAEGLRNVHRICRGFVLISAVAVALISFAGAPYIVLAFLKEETAAYDLAVNGFALFSISYLFNGWNIYTSGLFTALSDGKSSAIISFARTFIFIIVSLMILPKLMGINGVWLAVPLAEFLTIFLSVGFERKKLPQYVMDGTA